jgi:3-oxoacyl-[acyl-carrier-protein] synthase III
MERQLDFGASCFSQWLRWHKTMAGETKESNVLPVDETLHNHGNCIAASIPLGLEKLLHGGSDVSQKSVLVLGTGAGLTLGGMSIRFS